MTQPPVRQDVLALVRGARAASRDLARLGSGVKNRALERMAQGLLDARERLAEENRRDLEAGRSAGLSAPLLDRLRLDDRVLRGMAEGLREIARLPDPVGEVTRMARRPNGLEVGRMRIPLGVILIIYEARPNVTADAAGLCLKSGNAVLLRGGSEALRSNRAVGEVLRDALRAEGIPEGAVQVVPDPDRAVVEELLRREEEIDLVIPRGGESLIRFVAEKSRIPVVKHYKGVCHVFVDASADPGMAESITVNAKVQRPAVCNALETLLVHREIAGGFLPRVVGSLRARGVEIRGCEETRRLVPDGGIVPAAEEDWSAEYLDLILAVRVVGGIEEAMDHIARYGSNHTEAIVTRDYANGRRFVREVQSSLVLVNASTRFNDGFQLGLGAEMGISTSKIHAFGPMGLEELTTRKFIAFGDGQIRES